jgi:hypothetical protein
MASGFCHIRPGLFAPERTDMPARFGYRDKNGNSWTRAEHPNRETRFSFALFAFRNEFIPGRKTETEIARKSNPVSLTTVFF